MTEKTKRRIHVDNYLRSKSMSIYEWELKTQEEQGLSRETIYRWLVDKNITVETATKLSKALETDISTILSL